MAITLNALQKQRRDTASNWTSNNTVLLAGEIGWETDTRRIKIGDGTTAWQSLDYLPIPDVNRLLTGNLTVGGNFTVNGTTTTIDTTTLTVEDKNIEIGKVSTPTDTTADGGGITLKGATDKTINWVDSTDSWTLSEHLDLASGKVLKVAGTEILSATTLGSSVVSSSLTSVGTIATGVWNATAISGTKVTPDFGSQNIVTTGGLTVDTTTLHVDSSNNRVGIGTTSPSTLLQLLGSNSSTDSTGGTLGIRQKGDTADDGITITSSHANSGRIYKDSNGNLHIYNTGGNSNNFVLTNNGNLGLGTDSATAPFHIVRSGTSQNLAIFESDLGTNNNRTLIIGSPTSDSSSEPFRISTGNAIAFEIDGSQKLLIDSSGNIVATGTISGTLANGVVATTQSASDNSTKVATTAYVDNQVSSAGGGISNVVEDTTPQLGGNLDMQSNNITGTGNINTTGQIGRDSNDYIAFTDNTQLDVYINGNNEFRFEADGDFHADGDVIAESTTIASDEKLKENINLIDNPIEKIKQIRGVTFDWKRDGKKSAGVIAQDIEKILPEAVKEVQGLKDDESYKTVNYNSLISILIESVKELTARVEELEAK